MAEPVVDLLQAVGVDRRLNGEFFGFLVGEEVWERALPGGVGFPVEVVQDFETFLLGHLREETADVLVLAAFPLGQGLRRRWRRLCYGWYLGSGRRLGRSWGRYGDLWGGLGWRNLPPFLWLCCFMRNNSCSERATLRAGCGLVIGPALEPLDRHRHDRCNVLFLPSLVVGEVRGPGFLL